jgi:ammonia channel protein AmtB
MAVDIAHWVSLTAPLTGVIAGIVAFVEGIPAAGLSLIAGSALAGAIGFMLSSWARAWLLERDRVEPQAD